jgi:hypothetical protein
MLYKKATCTLVDVEQISDETGLMKTAATKIGLDSAPTVKDIVKSEIQKHKTALFFRAKAIVADETNSNGDMFPLEEILKSYHTFVGVPFYTNHQNQDIEKARGKIIHAEWNPKDKGVYVIGFIDREAYPHICRGVEQDYMTGVSMGAAIEYSECSVCHNRAENPEAYCGHIKMMKGRKFTGTVKDVKTGETLHLREHPVYEINYGIRFIELSGVGDPACKSCHIQGVFDNDEVLQKAASVSNNIYMYRESSLSKQSSQEEITQLEQALVALEQISVNLIKNRKQVEVAFASDLVKILSELQEFTDELVGAGYAQAPAAPGGESIPGTAMPPSGTETLPGAVPAPLPGEAPQAMPIGEAVPAVAPFAGPAASTGVPGVSGVQRPTMPTPPVRGLASVSDDRIRKIGNRIRYLIDRMEEGDNDMKRRTPAVAAAERDDVKRTLTASMQEKGGVFGNTDNQGTSRNDKNGGTAMSEMTRSAERQDAPEVTTQKQLDGGVKYHPRTGVEADGVTQSQLEGKRKDDEKNVVTEKQLEAAGKRGEAPDRITQVQLESERSGNEQESITQAQLESQRKDDEKNVVTEKQLDSKPGDIWARSSFSRKSIVTAAEHLKAVVSSLAKSAVDSCATPSQIRDAVASMVSGTQVKTAVLDAITAGGVKVSSDVGVAARAKFWGAKGITIASATKDDVRKSISDNLNVLVATNEGIHPEMVMDVLDVVSEEKDSLKMISEAVDAMLVDKPEASGKTSSAKDEIRLAFKGAVPAKKDAPEWEPRDKGSDKDVRKQERDELTLKASKPDRVIVASFQELGITKEEAKANPGKFKQAIVSLASAAATTEKRVLAAVTNVSIDPDGSVNIAIDTKDGKQEVELPLEGETPEAAPEGDATGEGLDELMAPPVAGAPAPAAPAAPTVPPPEAPLPTAASKNQMTKEAQFGGGAAGAGGGPNMPGGMSDPAAPGIGEKPGMQDAVQSFTDTAEPKEEAPGVGEQMLPGSICPFCHSTDTTTGKKGMEPGAFECNECSARYLFHVNVEVLNPESMEFEKGKKEEGKVQEPELPEMPVAAYTKLDKDSLVKIASTEKKFGHVCPACGMVECKPIEQKAGHTAYVCPSCNTRTDKDVLVSKEDASDAYLRVAWTLSPSKIKTANCPSCKEKARKFAAKAKVARMVKAASDNAADPKTAFPRANCVERISRMYGANALASYGECRGKILSDCVCSQLETFGLRKKIHMVRLAEVFSQPDPMDECLKIHMDKGFKRAQAETMCKAMRKECSTEADSNSLLMAFADTKEFTKEELEAMNEYQNRLSTKKAAAVEEMGDLDGDIGDPLEAAPGAEQVAPVGEQAPEETVMIELPKEVAQSVAEQVDEATAAADVVEGSPEVGAAGDLEVSEEAPAEAVDLTVDATSGTILGIKVIKTAAQPTKIEHIEKDVEAGIPRAKATIGKEQPATEKKPEIPRSDARQGDEPRFDAKLPDIPVDSATMGGEAEAQKGMPAVNNEIKGTVIAGKKSEITKEAKTPTLVEHIEKDVEAGVPRAKATIGKEQPATEKKPEIPRGDASMGGEEKFQEKLPDVPVDSSYLGGEAEAQKGTPGVSSDIKGTVIAEMRERQLDKLAAGRHKKACVVAAKLAGEGRISSNDIEEVAEVLSKLEMDKMEAFANKMFKMPKMASAQATLPVGIVQEASVYAPEQQKSPVEELSAAFTIGSDKLNKSLVEDGKR